MSKNRQQLNLGYLNSSISDELLSLCEEDRRRHLYVIGQTGSGKTTFLKNCILQDLLQGAGLALIDPHGDLADEIIDALPRSRVRDVVFLNPLDREHPIGFNPLARVPDHQRALVVSNIIACLRSIWRTSWGPRMEHVLANTLAALMESPEGKPMTMLAIPKMLTDLDFRRGILRHVNDPVVRDFWQNEFAGYDPRLRAEIVSPILNKVGAFMRNPLLRNILGQTKQSLDLRYMMDNRKILIVTLSKGQMGEDVANLLGSLLTTAIYQSAMERADQSEEERQDFHLYIDEFQNFTTDAFDAIVSEARKYRLCMTIAHQYLDQIPIQIKQAILGNIGSMLLFTLSGKDAEELAVELHPHTSASLRETTRGEALALCLHNGERRAPERIRIPYGQVNTNSRARVIRNTRTRFGQKPLRKF